MEDGKQDLIKDLTIEIASTCNVSDIKLLQSTIEKELANYNIFKMESTLPTTGDGSATKLLFEKFIAEKMTTGISKGTIEQYLLSVKKLFMHTGKEVTVITKDDLVNYLAFYRFGGENPRMNGKQLSENSVSNRYHYLSSFFTWLYKNRYIYENPFDRIPSIKSFIPKKEVITSHEMEEIMIACEKEYTNNELKLYRNTAIVLFLLESGARANELCNIRIEDLDLDHNKVYIREGKGGKQRYTCFGGRTKARISKYLEYKAQKGYQLNADDYLFTHFYRDKKLTPSGVECIIREISKLTNIPRLHPHLFRATFATNLIEKDVAPTVVQNLMGHESLDTLNSYVQTTDKFVSSSLIGVYN